MTAREIALPLQGGCLCGAVRYRIEGAPLLAYVCHCHNCQTRSGAAFSLSILVRSADLAIDGPMHRHRRTSARGAEIDYGFCGTCGVLLNGCAVATSDFTSLFAGTLDDAGWVEPIAQTWVDSALPWAIIPGVRQVAPKALDYAALSAEWRASAPRFR